MSALLKQMLADSPAGLWPLDEASGTTAYDRSGNGRNGTYTGTVNLGTRKVGPLAGADFAGGYVTIPDNSAFSATGAGGALTVLAWVVADALTNSEMIVAKGSSSNYEYRLNTHTDGKLYYVATNSSQSGETNGLSTTVMTTGRAYQVGAIYDRTAGTITPILDGTFEATTALTVTQGDFGAALQIGRRADAGGTVWDGVISHVAIYQSVLTQERVRAQYKAGIRSGVVAG